MSVSENNRRRRGPASHQKIDKGQLHAMFSGTLAPGWGKGLYFGKLPYEKQLQEGRGRGYFDSQVEGAFHCGGSKKQELEANSHMTFAARKKRAQQASSLLCNLGPKPRE